MHAYRQVGFLLVLLFVAGLNPLTAKTLTFDEQKCQCTVPDDWTEMKVPGNQASFINSDRTKSFILRIAPVPKNIALDNASFIKGFEGSMTNNGATITDRQHLPLGGIDAYVVDSTTPVPAGTANNRMSVTLANGFAYGFDISKVNAKPSDDDELNAITKSFAFIGTPEVHHAEDPMDKVGFYTGIFIGVLAVVSIIKWLSLRGKARSNP
jgi:hypothetical protein